MTADLTGSTALITGATSGIGKATALRLGTLGAHVVEEGAQLPRLSACLELVAHPPVAEVQIDVQLGTTPGLRAVTFPSPRFRDTVAPRLAADPPSPPARGALHAPVPRPAPR